MLASACKDMIKSISDVGGGQDISLLQVSFSLHIPGPAVFLVKLSSWTFSPVPEGPCPCKRLLPQQCPLIPHRAGPPHQVHKPCLVPNQCPFTAANALIAEASLAVTYLSHYTLIIQGNFKQID